MHLGSRGSIWKFINPPRLAHYGSGFKSRRHQHLWNVLRILTKHQQLVGRLVATVAVSIQLSDIRDEKFLQSNFVQASMGHATIGVGGLKTLTNRLYLNIDAGVILGSENLTELTGKQYDRFFVGLSSFQGILFVPTTKWAVVLKAGIFEEVLTSKLYQYDIGILLGIGLKF